MSSPPPSTPRLSAAVLCSPAAVGVVSRRQFGAPGSYILTLASALIELKEMMGNLEFRFLGVVGLVGFCGLCLVAEAVDVKRLLSFFGLFLFLGGMRERPRIWSSMGEDFGLALRLLGLG